MTARQSSLRTRDSGRHIRRYVVLGLVGGVLVGALLLGWNVLLADRGEILYLSDEPLPGQSGRIARHSITHIDDPAALRARVDDRTDADHHRGGAR